MIGCLPRVLEVPQFLDDTEVPRILWVKCATSAECKTIRIAVSMVKDSWVTALGLRPLVFKPGVCEMIMERGSMKVLCDNVGHGGCYQLSGLYVSVV